MVASGADERMQPVVGADPDWRDEVAFTAWDPGSGLFVSARLAVWPNRTAATGGLLAWLGARPVFSYGHALDEVPRGDWDGVVIAGLRTRIVEPLRSGTVSLDDGENSMALGWEGVSGLIDHPGLPAGVAAGHVEQAVRMTGRVALQGFDIDLDGVGTRAHTWGVRDRVGAPGWHRLTGLFCESDRAVALWLIDHDPSDGPTVHGFVHDAGADLRLEAAEVTAVEGGVAGVEAQRIDLQTGGGRTFGAVATMQGVESSGAAAGGATVHQRLVRLRTDDGLDGFGLSERLVLPPALRPTAGS